jgi:hypothetical protein
LNVQAEVVEPRQDYQQPQVRLTHVRALGIFGTLLAILTMLAAVGVGFVAFFATSLLAAAIVTVAWPLVFSAEFTQWVFGAPHASFWKFFLMFLAAGTVAKVLKIRRK